MPTAPVPFWRLKAIAFAVGAASLGAEIAAARLLAPYFGASTIIWANTIATVLVALSVGYAVGGRLADRRADLRGLCAIVLFAAMLLAIVPFVSDPFLREAVKALGALSVGGFLGSLAAVLVLVAVPGAAARHGGAVRQPAGGGSCVDTGTVTGRLYSISTAGSLRRHVPRRAPADPADRDPPHVPGVRAWCSRWPQRSAPGRGGSCWWRS